MVVVVAVVVVVVSVSGGSGNGLPEMVAVAIDSRMARTGPRALAAN